MSASPPVNGCERSNAAERGDRADAGSASPEKNRTTRSARVLTTLVGAVVLVAGLGGAAFAVHAVLELGALVRDVMALVSKPEPAAISRSPEPPAKPPRSARAKRAARAKRVAAASAAAARPVPDSKPTAADATVTPEPAGLELNVATAPAREDIEDALLVQKVSSAPFEDAAEASEKSRPLSVMPAPPLARVECPEVFVYIVSVVESDARLSVASLGIGQDGPARMRHLGDRIGDWKVAAITDDWSGLRPEVWLVRGETYCRAKLAGNPSRAQGATPPPRPPRARPATRPSARKAPPAIETATLPAERVAPPAATATPSREAAAGPAKKATKSKARRRRRR